MESLLDMCVKAFQAALEMTVTTMNHWSDDLAAHHTSDLSDLKLGCAKQLSDLEMNIMVRFNSALDDLKESLYFLRVEVLNLKQKCSCRTNDLESQLVDGEMKRKISVVSGQLRQLEVKIIYVKNQSQHNNLQVDEFLENPREEWSSMEAKVHRLLMEILRLPPAAIERAHHEGCSKQGKPRTIAARFVNFKDRENILSKARLLHDKSFVFYQDFLPRVFRKRQELLPKLQEAMQEQRFQNLHNL